MGKNVIYYMQDNFTGGGADGCTTSDAITKPRSAEVAATGAVGTMGQIRVTADGSPAKILFKNSRESTFTYTHDNAAVQSITANGDGTETWVINLKVYRKTETYKAYAKYASGWTEDFVTFTLAAK